MAQEIGDKQMIAYSYDILANIYLEQKKPDKTIEYYTKSIAIKEPLNVRGDLEYSLYHLSRAYIELKNFGKATEILNKAIELSLEMDYLSNVADCYTSLANISIQQQKYDSAIEYLEKGMNIAAKMQYTTQIADANNYLGDIYLTQNRFDKAYTHYNQAYIESDNIKYSKAKLNATQGLKKVAIHEGNYKLAYQLFENEKNLIDSSNIEMAARKAMQIELQLQYENEQNLKNAEITRQKTIKNFSLGLLLIFIVLAAFILYSYIGKQRDNKKLKAQRDEIELQRHEIELQKDLLAEQNKKITDSIFYARRIQTAVLPRDEAVVQLLPEHFILYKPRDIVSGDFYFIRLVKNLTIIAVADCTGHGVPGAFMSMLGVAILNELIQKPDIQNAAKLLNELRNQIKNSLQQTGEKGEQQDGLDIAFCVINRETLEMSFAGAHNPCWIFRSMNNEQLTMNNEKDTLSISCSEHSRMINYQLSILEADHQPVGVYLKEKPFTEQTFQLQKNDTFYIFTDGYHSQFGGERNLPMKSKYFKQILSEICYLPLDNQKQILETKFNEWRGNEEQTDDVLVVGVRV